jgi:hypothetical protein
MLKKGLLMILAVLMAFPLLACSADIDVTETAELNKTVTLGEESFTQPEKKDPPVIPEGFTVGYGRVLINPEPGTGLGGYGNADTRLSASIQDNIYLTCTAVSDGQNTVLLFSSDTIHVGSSIAAKVGDIAMKNYGIPVENVIMNGTHSHSSPALYNSSYTGMAKYVKMYYGAAQEAMDAALRDLAPAEIYTGSGRTQNLNYVRRYVTLDGKTFLGNWPDSVDPSYGRHETEADNQLQVIRFERGEKKDIVLVNWQCHTTTTSTENSTSVSADWVKGLRDKMEKDGDVLFSYHQGAAGNVIPNSAMKGEKNNRDYIKHGEEIADVALKAMENMTKRESGAVRARKLSVSYNINEKYRKKEKLERTTETANMTAISIGDVAFASVSGELHDTLGMELKEKSPFAMTFVCAYTNGTNGYLPAEFAWNVGGYEVDSTHFVKGTPENMVERLLEVLNEFYQAG